MYTFYLLSIENIKAIEYNHIYAQLVINKFSFSLEKIV